MKSTRRQILKTLGTAGTATLLAGCSDSEDKNTDSQTETQTTDTQQDKKTSIEFTKPLNTDILPIVNDRNIDNSASISLEVKDQDGLESVRVAYNDSHREEPLALYDRTRDEFEQGVNGEMVPISEEFPQRLLAPKTGEFHVEVTDTQGNTETRRQGINNLNGSYRANRKRTDTGNIGSYTTERNWDNLNTNTEEIRKMQTQWTKQEAYTPLVNQVMNGEDLSPGNKIFPNWEGEDDGFFDQDAVQNEDDFETLVRWYLPLIRYHDRENYGNAPSSRNYRFAATLETLINDHHPSAEAKATNAQSLPGHGIFGVQDQNNEEFYLVDTTPTSAQTDSAVGRIGEFITSEDGNRSELWDPFHSFEPGAQGMHYEGKTDTSMAGLFNFVENKGSNDQIDYDSFFITDEWMDDAYKVLRNGGSIQPIVEPIEEIIYESIKQNKEGKTGIYGNLDDTRIAVTSNEEVYETVMYDETTKPGIEEIETMLEAA